MAADRFPILRGLDAQQSRVQDNVQGVLGPVAKALQNTPIMGAAAPSWIRPDQLLNGWSNFGGAQAPVGYHRDALGYVHVRGYLTAGTLAAVIFTLPLGYRPAFPTSMLTYCFNGAVASAFLEVRVNGGVFVSAPAATTELSLGSFSFLAEG